MLNPRAPNAPVMADVPLRCMPTTKSHEPVDRSEVVPRRFGLLMGEAVSRAPLQLCPACQAATRAVNEWSDCRCIAEAAHRALREVPLGNPNDVGEIGPRFRSLVPVGSCSVVPQLRVHSRCAALPGVPPL